MREKKGCCYEFFYPLRKEFKVEKFSLEHQPVDVFFISQWQRDSRSKLWLLYRCFLAIFFTVGVLGSLIQYFNNGKWFIYLTDWGFVLCMYVHIYSAILAILYYNNWMRFEPSSWVIKIYWLSHWSTLSIAGVVTFIYWLFLFPNDQASATAVYNLWSHAFNSIMMILDLMLVAFPARLLHTVYPLSIGLLYGLFSYIYYAAGGLNITGDRFIYDILDWADPGWAVLTLVGCTVLMLIFCCCFFGLYKLRCWLHRKTRNSTFTVNA